MKKKAGALALCLLLVFALSTPPVQAAGSVYFTAAGNEILPLDDSTMPFWADGYLYVASSIFTGQVNKSLGIAVVYLPSNVSNPNQCILYRDSRTLMFDLNGNFVRDVDGNITFRGAVQRNGEVFVPASVVADFFDLEYSVTPLSLSTAGVNNYGGALVWLRRPNFGLSEQVFINAASTQIAMRYEQYLRDHEEGGSGESGNTPGDTHPPDSAEEKSVFLCLEAGGGTAALLDTLEACGAQAAFFCSQEFLEDQGDLLRRMTATGQAVGLLVDAADPAHTVSEQLEAGNRALARATMGKTRLAKIQNGDEPSLREARELGFSCLAAELDRSGGDLRNTAQAEALLRQISAQRGDVRIWLADSASAAGLQALLSAAGPVARCLALTEMFP